MRASVAAAAAGLILCGCWSSVLVRSPGKGAATCDPLYQDAPVAGKRVLVATLPPDSVKFSNSPSVLLRDFGSEERPQVVAARLLTEQLGAAMAETFAGVTVTATDAAEAPALRRTLDVTLETGRALHFVLPVTAHDSASPSAFDYLLAVGSISSGKSQEGGGDKPLSPVMPGGVGMTRLQEPVAAATYSVLTYACVDIAADRIVCAGEQRLSTQEPAAGSAGWRQHYRQAALSVALALPFLRTAAK